MEMNDQVGPFRGGYPTSSSNSESYSDEYLIVSNNTIYHSSDSGFPRQELLDKGQGSKTEQTDINNSIVSSGSPGLSSSKELEETFLMDLRHWVIGGTLSSGDEDNDGY
ncbi:hypothetical protein LIER_22567 [Lithospermum erythrorhizon]|uniref:Uncharacterized protein n=1 Tax=Lithospermum erythrorhizon TaxID=34254 RepID=A0AAV3QVL6_LITER